MRRYLTAVLLVMTAATSAGAQSGDTLSGDKTFLVRRDLAYTGIALAATGILSHWDPKIARWSQTSSFHDSSYHSAALRISKVNETTLTVGGIVIYGIGRLSGQRTVADVALHATESVVIASLASQLIRGPLGRARPYVTGDSDQYDFKFGRGFQKGEEGFKRRAFPSIHTSSSMAVATVLSMEMKRRNMRGAAVVAPVLFAAGLLPGIARIQLDQHWASDVFAGAAMGVFAGYKVVNYSHAHPNNVFDRVLLKATVMPSPSGGFRIGFAPEI